MLNTLFDILNISAIKSSIHDILKAGVMGNWKAVVVELKKVLSRKRYLLDYFRWMSTC